MPNLIGGRANYFMPDSGTAKNSSKKTLPVIKCQQGFTLVELVVVILILGIIAINVGSRFFGASAYSDRKVADELIEAIRYAQHVAMSRGGGIQLVTTTTSYTVQDTAGPTILPNPNKSGDYSVTVPANSSLTAVSITFNGLGQPTPTTDSTITVGSRFTITVEGDTGYAHY